MADILLIQTPAEDMKGFGGCGSVENEILVNEFGTEVKPGNQLPEWKRARLENQQYRLVGNHTAVKICYWCKKSIRGEENCYKKTFYGINTHRCLEMSPAITCNQRCKHCWRDTSVFSKGWVGPVDEPKAIVDGCIEARKQLLIGFKGNKKVDLERFDKEVLIPDHVAISLTGEPCMYPKLPELVSEFFNRGVSTVFLVTHGTVPKMLERFKQERAPTNIYLSVEATNEQDYIQFCIPVIENAWQKVMESMDTLKELAEMKRTRTVMRITCVKGFNMDKAAGFVQHIERMRPMFVEAKGYTYMGYSIQRMKAENVPGFDEVLEFAKQIESLSGYEIVDARRDSEVVLLRRRDVEYTGGINGEFMW